MLKDVPSVLTGANAGLKGGFFVEIDHKIYMAEEKGTMWLSTTDLVCARLVSLETMLPAHPFPQL